MATRDNILNALRLRLDTAVAALVTVKRSVKVPVEILRYTRSQLPALFIPDPVAEKYQYQGSRHSYTTFEVDILLYLESWDAEGADPADLNALLDSVLVSIHSDITNGGTSVNTSVLGVARISQTFPLYCWAIKTRFEYYHDYTAR